MIAPTMRMTIQKDVGQVKCWMQEEQGETAGGVSNDEETDQDNAEDNVVDDRKESSSSLQPEAEESESK